MVSDPGTSISGCRVALLSCGQFDPPSYAHLRMFERARDFLVRTMGCKVVEGIMNVGQDTATTHTPAKHRLRMVETAVRKNFWIRAGDFECKQRSPIRQLAVLKHYQEKLSHKHDETIRVMYVCGSEVLEDLVAPHPENPCSWNHSEIKELLQKHGLIVLKRGRTRPSETIYLTDVLRQYQKNIYVIEDETFPNDLRCSRIRTALRRGESVKYCLDDDVIEYINEHNLYKTTLENNYNRCDPGIRSGHATTVLCDNSGTMRINGDEQEMPPEAPQSPCTEVISSTPIENSEPATNSPLLENKSSDCDEVPNCMVSSVTLDFEKKLGGLADSPSYDNVTLDDLLVATTSWADYLQGESERIGGLNNESYKEPTVPSDPPSSNTSRTKEDKKRSWFFNSNNSLKEPKPPEEDQLLMRKCATDRRQQKQAPSEILWRRNSHSKGKERWSEILPPSRPPPHCLQHPEQHTAKLRKEPNSGTSRLKNPPEDEQQTEVREPTLPNNVETARSHFEATTTVDDGVTLRYRCYNLTSTPETTV